MSKQSRINYKSNPPTINKVDSKKLNNKLNRIIQNINNIYSANKNNNFLINLGHDPQSLALLLLCNYLNNDNRKTLTLFIPSLSTKTYQFDLINILQTQLSLDLHIFPIKFLQSILNNSFKDHFKDLFTNTPPCTASLVEGLITEILTKTNHHLYLAKTTKTDRFLAPSKIIDAISCTYFPLIDFYNHEIIELIPILNNLISSPISNKIINQFIYGKTSSKKSLDEIITLDTIIEMIHFDNKDYEFLKDNDLTHALLDKTWQFHQYAKKVNYNFP